MGNGGIEEASNAFATRGLDVGLTIVDEEGFGAGRGEFFEDVTVNFRLGFHTADFRGKNRHVEVAQPRRVFAKMVRERLVEIGEQGEFVAGGMKALDDLSSRRSAGAIRLLEQLR